MFSITVKEEKVIIKNSTGASVSPKTVAQSPHVTVDGSAHSSLRSYSNRNSFGHSS